MHYEHQARLGYIRLGAQDRLQIAGILAQGVTWDKILDDVCTSVSDNFKRILSYNRNRPSYVFEYI